jgi:hypothetical protein
MSYAIGNPVAASDYNALFTTLASVYGVGSGDAGYGQTQYTLAAVAAGGKIGSAEWTALRDALAVCRQSQTGSVPSLVPPTAVLEAGDKVVAHESSSPSSNAYDLDSEVSAAYMNRFTANSLATGSLSGASSATRSGSWGGDATDGIQLVFDVTWSSTDEARYFFNSGGESICPSPVRRRRTRTGTTHWSIASVRFRSGLTPPRCWARWAAAPRWATTR